MWQLSHSPRSPATELKPIMRRWNPNKALDGNDSHVWLQRVVYARVPELPTYLPELTGCRRSSTRQQLWTNHLCIKDRFLLLSSTSQVKSSRAKELVPVFNDGQLAPRIWQIDLKICVVNNNKTIFPQRYSLCKYMSQKYRHQKKCGTPNSRWSNLNRCGTRGWPSLSRSCGLANPMELLPWKSSNRFNSCNWTQHQFINFALTGWRHNCLQLWFSDSIGKDLHFQLYHMEATSNSSTSVSFSGEVPHACRQGRLKRNIMVVIESILVVNLVLKS